MMENQDSLWHKVLERFEQPEVPWVILVTASLYSLITGRYDVGGITGSLFILSHLVARHISLDIQLDAISFSLRESASVEMEKCVCGHTPEIFFLEDADHFYVRCDHCLRQGLPGYDADDAIALWGGAMIEHNEGGTAE